MNPIFTLSYSEYKVAEELKQLIKDSSIWFPISAQEKGIDLLLYKRINETNKFITIQVKSSRSYKFKKYNNYFWLNRFEPNPNADFFAIIGTYAHKASSSDNFALKDILWDDIILIFTYEEICDLLAKAVTQKEGKPDKMWAFAFNDVKHIFIARGKHKNEEITKYLLGNKISEIEQKFLE